MNLVPFTGTRPGHKKREESISSRVEAAAVCGENGETVREWVVRTVVKHTLDDHIGIIKKQKVDRNTVDHSTSPIRHAWSARGAHTGKDDRIARNATPDRASGANMEGASATAAKVQWLSSRAHSSSRKLLR